MTRRFRFLVQAVPLLLATAVMATAAKESCEDDNDGFVRGPRGAAAVIYPSDVLQVVELVGPEAGKYVPWERIQAGRPTIVVARIAPNGFDVVRRIAAEAQIETSCEYWRCIIAASRTPLLSGFCSYQSSKSSGWPGRACPTR